MGRMTKIPTLIDAFERWPSMLDALKGYGMPESYGLNKRLTDDGVRQCLAWALGDDWTSLRFDRIPERLATRINLSVSLDDVPEQTMRAIRERWDSWQWTLATQRGH